MNFKGGYTGRCLDVNLANGSVKVVPTDGDTIEKYLGGRGLAAKMLFDRWTPGSDAFSSDTPFVLATGPLNGTPTLLTPKYCIATISPLTGLYTKSLSGGHFAAELKYAGFDAISIIGRSEKPVYLAIKDGEAELRDAGGLWGVDNHVCEDRIRDEWGDPGVSVASIGVAGERLVRYASVTNDRHRSAGRGGTGAVMGSKNLKAIAVRGTGGVSLSDLGGFWKVLRRTYENSVPTIKSLSRRMLGTQELTDIVVHFGILPVNNFSLVDFDKSENINAPAFKKFIEGDRACFSCNLACGKITRVDSGRYAGTSTEGPEYESIGMLGPNLGIGSPEFLIKADVLCDEYGIDTISAGGTIGLAIDLFERGLLTKDDTGGMELRWGDPDTVLELLRMIGERQGDFAERLGEGSRRLAERYGVPELAPHSKGQEFPAYDPRGAQGFALQYATSNRGACHLTASVFSAEITSGKVDRFATEGKAKLVRDAAIFVAFIECGVFCLFMRYVLTMDDILEFIKTVTGRALSNDDTNVIGERIYSIERLINIGQGMTREQDTLPEKFLSQPIPRGPSEGQVVRLHEMLGEYYDIMGYDESGRPTAQSLNRLGLTEEAKKV